MKESKGFVAAAAAGAVAFVVFRAILVSPVTAAKDDEIATIRQRLAERESYFPPGGLPIDEVKERLEAEKATIAELKQSVGQVELEVPEELKPTEGRDTLYFQQQLAKLRARAASSRVSFENKAAPLGFTQSVTEETVPEFLARLEVASRFIEAAASARIGAVMRAEHPASRPGPGGGGRQVKELPMKVVAAADEKSLIRLLQELSRPGRFLALKGLGVEVKDPSSGYFEATIELAGVTVVAAADAVGPGTPGSQEPDPGKTVPTTPFRRRF